MKGISEVISTIITASSIIIVSILIFYLAVQSLNTTMQTSEYGYIKSSLINVAATIPEIIKGTSVSFSVPQGTIGVGYHVNNNLVYEVDILTSNGWINITVDDQVSALIARSQQVMATTGRLVYGRNELVVGDPALLPTIWEYYNNTSTYLNFNVSRFYVNTYYVKNLTTTITYIRIYYLQLRPKYIAGPHTVMFVPGGTVIDREFIDTSNTIIRVIDKTTDKVINEINFHDIYQLGYQVNVLLLVEELNVVLA